jgi:thiol-disulfide isomerase/thioredoxin
MSLRRPIVVTLSVTAVVLLIAGMVRYTRRVETELKGAKATGGSVKLLKERPLVPAFTATDLNGRPVSLAALRGKVVIVNFWATWCPPCREEIPDLIALQHKYQDRLQIIGVSQDSGSPEEVRRFAAGHGMNYPTIMSTPEIEQLFPGVYALPTSFILDREGHLAQKHIGQLSASLTETETLALSGSAPETQTRSGWPTRRRPTRFPASISRPCPATSAPRRCRRSTPSTAPAAAVSRSRSAASTTPTAPSACR